MNAAILIEELHRKDVLELAADALAQLLTEAEVVAEHDTVLSGTIRILGVDDRSLVQERDPDGTVYLRAMANRAAAEAFVSDRLATYERMWDGCGCKVRYRS